MFKEFRTFVMRGSVIDLAVGVVVGAASPPSSTRWSRMS